MKKLFFLTFILLTFLQFQNGFAQPKSKHKSDFDFYIGEWEVKNKRLVDKKWINLDAKVSVIKTLNGFANVDFFESKTGNIEFHGMTVRVYDKDNDEWHIRWIDTDDPLSFPKPSIGKFEDGEGKFYKQIITESGNEVTIRFYWNDIKENSFKWEAAWTTDMINFNPVWLMEFERIKN